MFPILLGVTFISFILLHAIPGDPAETIVGFSITPEALEKTRHELGLDKPLHLQYFIYLKNIVQGNLGYSFRTNRPVATEVVWRLQNSLKLALVAMIMAVFIGGIIGIFSSLWSGRFLDNIATILTIVSLSIPSFWVGTLLILLISVYLGVLPAGGMSGPLSFILPGFTLAIPPAAYLSQMLKTNLSEVLEMDYIRTARAKGASTRIIVVRHSLKNALMPALTVLGLQFGYIMGGSVVVETLYSWPGLGRMVVTSIIGRDYPMVQGAVLILAVIFIFVNLIVDVIYFFLDPRLKAKIVEIK